MLGATFFFIRLLVFFIFFLKAQRDRAMEIWRRATKTASLHSMLALRPAARCPPCRPPRAPQHPVPPGCSSAPPASIVRGR
ncbi:hypothetical protein BRADI_3g50632v3 [Brachypodium distachyon]|uniref:Uncharacterized protein n=1 Tax=Brachypodium distachyon TaxID=15368 RepID=A0A2K2D4G0_BRADI|nr:hypothetical protein BRADI_3g50632v3 [Brachypodium distachyon]